MAPLTTESQFTFLISCIRHSDNGKVDFQKVAQECEIVSKAAAAKRYERLMKAHGIHQSQLSARDTSVASGLRKNATSSPDKGKKRKLDEYENQNNTGDDDEGLAKSKEEGLIKAEGSSKVKVKAEGKPKIKAEQKGAPVKKERRESAVVKPDPSQLDGAYDVLDEGKNKIFDDFLEPGVFQDQKPLPWAVDNGMCSMSAFGTDVGSGFAASDSIVIAD